MGPQDTTRLGSPSAGGSLQRPWLVTVAGIVAIVAGMLPGIETIAMVASPRFQEWFLGLLQTILPASPTVLLALLGLVAVANILLGVGTLTRRRWAPPGMIMRSVLGVWLDYINFRAGNHAGAAFGLAVNIFVFGPCCGRNRVAGSGGAGWNNQGEGPRPRSATQLLRKALDFLIFLVCYRKIYMTLTSFQAPTDISEVHRLNASNRGIPHLTIREFPISLLAVSTQQSALNNLSSWQWRQSTRLTRTPVISSGERRSEATEGVV